MTAQALTRCSARTTPRRMTRSGPADLAAAQYKPFSFTAKRLILAALVDKAISVVPTRDVMPVLKHFLVQVAPGRLQMAATDLELSVLASTPAVTTERGRDPGAACPQAAGDPEGGLRRRHHRRRGRGVRHGAGRDGQLVAAAGRRQLLSAAAGPGRGGRCTR